jgi:acetyltransferase-like isoleucine patch superfamily enzyme/dTDP-4-dehydrorhamnose 3,5-epimerase-like enzyme
MSQDIFVHEKALCESANVGRGTRIWAFAHVLPGAKIGCECNICDGVFIENVVTIGDRVTIKCGVQLWDATVIEDDVFIGPNATFTNDRFPRSKVYPEHFLKTVVRKGASIGANATILPGLEIGSGAMIGAGAVVTRSVPPNAIAVGNPARIVGYVDADGPTSGLVSREGSVRTASLGIAGVTLHDLPVIRDMRGSISVGEVERHVPFVPKRYFLVFDVPGREVRGEHAHRTCHQFLVCISGSCAVLVDDGTARREVSLDRPSLGLYLPPMVWSVQYKYTADAKLLVLASEYYDPDDYIRDYAEYRHLVHG